MNFPETIEHFLLQCLRFHSHRVVLQSQLLALNVTTFDLPTLLAAAGVPPSRQHAVIRLTCAFLRKTGQLPLYEDAAKKGSCIIQGLEEVLVRSKADVYTIMQKGSTKRQTAATLMNAHSSRSHTVFTVTLHMKENTVDGDELLKVRGGGVRGSDFFFWYFHFCFRYFSPSFSFYRFSQFFILSFFSVFHFIVFFTGEFLFFLKSIIHRHTALRGVWFLIILKPSNSLFPYSLFLTSPQTSPSLSIKFFSLVFFCFSCLFYPVSPHSPFIPPLPSLTDGQASPGGPGRLGEHREVRGGGQACQGGRQHQHVPPHPGPCHHGPGGEGTPHTL
ncbi:Kinesin-like protein Klp61F [Chionoecetes opilio]|uniref:Kinesin-like protein Klp61F n=1 Tax=Chionoecetes opilio TaxID=41210 RepID=A0A8J4YGN7_CHIOP|nr:Kinesin-like protein Klp61F [Chionoecetes opilio]